MSGNTVLCFGEALWDSLPRGIFPGGAPVNVAYHLNQFGLKALPVSAVGKDFLGDEYLRRFRYWDVAADHVARLDYPTGAVVVDLMENGIPTYQFLEDVAWDHIPVEAGLLQSAASASAVVFGTLAQRSPDNVDHLRALRSAMGNARHVFDVNLRSPYDSVEVVWELTKGCDLIKLNNEELAKILDMVATTDALKTGARMLAERTGCPRICVTAGPKGAGLWWGESWYWEPAKEVEVRDTVGSGDSFLAALMDGWIVKGMDPGDNLKRASRVAEFIAGRDGAMPEYDLDSEGMPVVPK